jgi:hypothetical protein
MAEPEQRSAKWLSMRGLNRNSLDLLTKSSSSTGKRTVPQSFIAVGSEEARLRAGLRPPLKLHVQVCCMQLSRRVSDAGMTEKELNRATEQAHTRRKAWAKAAASSQHCSNAYTDATKSVAGSSRRGGERAYERGRVCNTRPNPAIAG